MAIKRNAHQDLMLEDVPRLIFRNFAGRQGKYNRKGDRNFGALLRDEWVDEMVESGYSVKFLKPRDEDEEPAPWIKVKVNYDNDFPPEVIMITSRGRTTLDADTVELIDSADIASVDLVLNPWEYKVDDNRGWTMYLVRAYITINEDDFERKYNSIGYSSEPARYEASPVFTGEAPY